MKLSSRESNKLATDSNIHLMPAALSTSHHSSLTFNLLHPRSTTSNPSFHKQLISKMAAADDEQVNASSNSPSTALLPLNTELSTTSSITSPKNCTNNIIFIALIIAICVALAASFAFAFLYYSSQTHHNHAEITRPLHKLKNPVVLLVSSDGFRFGYQFKTSTPNIHRLITQVTEAEQGLIPVFPTLTFPNHYSIFTGLYPAHHGIVSNHFTDPNTNEYFSMSSRNAKWWLGEPLWETVTNHGLKAATYFWPGSEVTKGSWNRSSTYCDRYSGSVPFEDRVDHILRYFDLPSKEIPVFMTFYFEDPDHQGHEVGVRIIRSRIYQSEYSD